MDTESIGQRFELTVPGDANVLRGDAHVPDSPRAVVGIIHGLGEHHARYDRIAKRFNDEGLAVYKYDHPGHGESDGARGHAQSFDVLLDGVDALIDRIMDEHPELPIVLWGHSMGGGIVVNYVLRRGEQIAGAVATAPFLSLPVEPPKFQMLMGRIMNRIYPALSQNNSIDTKYLSHDPAEVEAYEKDPLVHPLISVRLAIELMEAGKWALQHAGKLSKPLFILHGTEDRLTSHKGSRQFAEVAGALCTYKEYDGAYHELHFDTVKEDMTQSMIDWINATLENAS